MTDAPKQNNGQAAVTLAEDILYGAEGISAFTGEPLRRVNYMLERGQLPAKKIAGRWYSTRSALRAHYTP